MSNPPSSPASHEPWWKIKMLWLVIGGPLAVVIAGFVTLGLALKHPDEVLKPSTSPAGASETAGQVDADAAAARMPALQARNHAATGGKSDQR